MKKAVYLFLAAFVLVGTASFSQPPHPRDLPYIYLPPVNRNDGWATSTLEAEQLDSSLISAMMSRVRSGGFRNIHSVLIARNEKLVLEEYLPGFTAWGEYVSYAWDVRHFMASCTKSVTSALVGMAKDMGLIANLDEKIAGFFPEYGNVDWGNGKADITIRHLLTMSAGLAWNEFSYSIYDARNDWTIACSSGATIRYVLERPMAAVPGSLFVYNTGLSTLLGAIVGKVAGMPVDQFAAQTLFAALGIQDFYWDTYADGTVGTGGDLYLRPRDMAKFGQLYLNKGVWWGRRVLSQEWVEESVKEHIPSSLDWQRYGYQWWIENIPWQGKVLVYFSARGWGGQRICVFPELNMVVVFTGGNYASEANPENTMLAQFILPATK